MKSLFRAVARATGMDNNLESSDSQEYLTRLSDFQDHVQDLQGVREAMMLYSDSIEAMIAAQVVLSDAISHYYSNALKASHRANMRAEGSSRKPEEAVLEEDMEEVYTPLCHRVAKSFQKQSLEFHSHVRPSLHDIFVSRCVRPVTSILSRVPYINELSNRRRKLLSEFRECNDILSSSSGARNTNTYEKTVLRLDEVSSALSTVNDELDTSLNEFLVSRPQMLSHELSAVIACVYHQANMMASQVGNLLPLLPQAASSLCLLQASAVKSQAKLDSSKEMRSRDNDLAEGNRVNVVLERSKVMGGRSGGYGVATASDHARRSLPSAVRGRSYVDPRSLMDRDCAKPAEEAPAAEDEGLEVDGPSDNGDEETDPPTRPSQHLSRRFSQTIQSVKSTAATIFHDTANTASRSSPGKPSKPPNSTKPLRPAAKRFYLDTPDGRDQHVPAHLDEGDASNCDGDSEAVPSGSWDNRECVIGKDGADGIIDQDKAKEVQKNEIVVGCVESAGEADEMEGNPDVEEMQSSPS